MSQEALWVLCNFCLTQNIENIKFLTQKGVIEFFGKFLTLEESCKKILLILEAIRQPIELF